MPMNRCARLDAIEQSLKRQADGRMVLPASEEGWHRMLLEGVDTISDLAREAFGADDPRADPDLLRSLSYNALLDVYGEAMNTVVERDLEKGSMDWFRALPLSDQVRLCRPSSCDENEIERLRRSYEESKGSRPLKPNQPTFPPATR
jgi:hypothetical protein